MNCSIAEEGRRALRSDKICIIKSRATGATALELGWESPQADCDDLQITAEKILAVPAVVWQRVGREPRAFAVYLPGRQRRLRVQHQVEHRHRPFAPWRRFDWYRRLPRPRRRGYFQRSSLT